MRINMKPHLDRKSILSHIVVRCAESVLEKICDDRYSTDGTIDIKMTANGVDLPVESFCEDWQGAVDDIVEVRAQALLTEKFTDIHNKLNGIEEHISELSEVCKCS